MLNNKKKRKINKIAIMVPNLNRGGAEKVAADLSVYFESKGYDVIIFVENKQKTKDYVCGGSIVYVHRSSGMKTGNTKIISFAELIEDVNTYRQLKKKYRIDVTISFMQASNLLNILSRYQDIVIVTLHSVMSKRTDLYKSFGYGKGIFKFLYQCADKIVLVSKYCQKDWINNFGDFFSKTVVIHNPVYVVSKQNCIVKNSNDFYSNSKMVISVARLDGVKQQWHLLRSFKAVLAVCPEAQLLIVGDGILKDALQNLSKQLRIQDNVWFLGFVNNVEKYLKMAQIIAVTSASESWCNAIAEAMLQGVPAVANDCPGGIRELMGIGEKKQKYNLITGCGIITPKLDGKKYTANDPLTKAEIFFAKGILRLLQDDNLRKRMSQNCIENIQQYALENIGGEWEKEIYKLKSKIMLKKIVAILINVFWSMLTFSFKIIVSNRNDIRKKENNFSKNDEKFVSYFNVLEQWMCLKENGKSVERYFNDLGYKKIAIYGMANMANHLIRELENTTIEISFGIDKRANVLYGKIPIISLNDVLPNIDVIVVTPVFDYTNIKKFLLGKTNAPVVSLEEVVNYSAG